MTRATAPSTIGPPPLARFQQAFARALHAPDEIPTDTQMAALVAQPGFAVYRNTVLKGAVDALVASHPAVTRLVGDEWLRAAAAVFVRAHPPRTPVLVEYGAGFAEFLRGFAPARDLPYLADVAAVERMRTEAHLAADQAAERADRLAGVTPEALAGIRLAPHAAARWAWFESHPAFTLWQRNRPGCEPTDAGIAWQAEGVLVTRPDDAVRCVAIDRAAIAFLDACANGETLLDAALDALRVDPHADLTRLMAELLAAGAFAHEPLSSSPDTGA